MVKASPISRLRSAIRKSRQVLEGPRKFRFDAVALGAGSRWSLNASKKDQPVNLIALYQQIVGQTLIAKAPRVLLSTFNHEQKPVVAAMQSWVNKEIERTNLVNVLQRIVIDALYSIGIAKVCIATPGDAARYSWQLKAGEPFVSRVDLDDFVYDIRARDFSEVSFIGHRFRAPLDAIRESKIYGPGRKNLKAFENTPNNETGDERIHMLGDSREGYDDQDFEDMVELWEIYCPRNRCVYTLAEDLGDDEALLMEQGWVGPDSGPYAMLGLGLVPGNAFPKAPIMDLIDLHEAANNAYRKLFQMIHDLKELTTYQKGMEADADAIRTALSGSMVGLNNPEAAKSLVTGANAMQLLSLMATALKDLFSFMGGNLELLGGRAPQSKTATQDELLNQNAGAGIADKQDRAVEFVSEVMKKLCWFYHEHPTKVMKTRWEPAGLPQYGMDREVYPHDYPLPGLKRTGDHADIEVKVDPYTMRHQTPQMKGQQLKNMMMNIITPLAPLLQSQQIVPDMHAFLEKCGVYDDMPDYQDILGYDEPPPQEEGSEMPHDRTLPVQTDRTYTRRNVGQASSEADSSQHLRQMLSGVDVGGAASQGIMT